MDATKHLPEPKTLQEAVVYFADPDRCFEYAKKLRWPDGNVVCPRCNAAKNSFIKTRRLWFCYACKRQFTIKVKTIMEDRSEEHTSELQSRQYLVCRLLLEKKKKHEANKQVKLSADDTPKI